MQGAGQMTGAAKQSGHELARARCSCTTRPDKHFAAQVLWWPSTQVGCSTSYTSSSNLHLTDRLCCTELQQLPPDNVIRVVEAVWPLAAASEAWQLWDRYARLLAALRAVHNAAVHALLPVPPLWPA